MPKAKGAFGFASVALSVPLVQRRTVSAPRFWRHVGHSAGPVFRNHGSSARPQSRFSCRFPAIRRNRNESVPILIMCAGRSAGRIRCAFASRTKRLDLHANQLRIGVRGSTAAARVRCQLICSPRFPMIVGTRPRGSQKQVNVVYLEASRRVIAAAPRMEGVPRAGRSVRVERSSSGVAGEPPGSKCNGTKLYFY